MKNKFRAGFIWGMFVAGAIFVGLAYMEKAITEKLYEVVIVV